MSNEELFIKYIEEVVDRETKAGRTTDMNPAWVLWMLNQIGEANFHKHRINPEWLRASHKITWLSCHGDIEDSEPPMFFNK